ncbi:MAG: hypothetical protein NTW86_05910 [Candidatus Sumerlaeota bacterium]|nr:hypothetical protein [Candidatus Sumerlaeota bacterium]
MEDFAGVLHYLDIVIGLVLIYAVLSLLTSTCTEFILQLGDVRGKFLKEVVTRLCGGCAEIVKEFYKNSRIRTLRRKDEENSLPSHIDPRTFAEAFLETITERHMDELRRSPMTLVESLSEDGLIKRFLGESPSGGIKKTEKAASEFLARLLAPIARQASGDADRVLAEVARLFRESNDRATGWFKRRVVLVNLLVGLVVELIGSLFFRPFEDHQGIAGIVDKNDVVENAVLVAAHLHAVLAIPNDVVMESEFAAGKAVAERDGLVPGLDGRCESEIIPVAHLFLSNCPTLRLTRAVHRLAVQPSCWTRFHNKVYRPRPPRAASREPGRPCGSGPCCEQSGPTMKSSCAASPALP